jgi:formate dehydrogenase iron-sulfur subunit
VNARIFVPRDAAADALGASEVAAAFAASFARRGFDDRVSVIRTSSRGLFWLEPLVEVEIGGVRHGYGPVAPADVDSLVDAGLFEGRPHRLALGPVEAIPFLARQQRVTFARAGLADPLDIGEYRRLGGFAGLEAALRLGAAGTLDTVEASGLRGRGGAGFPTGRKWRTAAGATADARYLVCNADEGDSGAFADRMAMEGDPFALIEGMAIAGFAIGAGRGYLYIRSEYPDAIRTMAAAIAIARREGLLGEAIGGVFAFDIEIRVGAGSYVCGEETALLESIEGRRGMVRAKPPIPAISGLFGRPTVVNNVLTLASVPWILAHGADAYAGIGYGRSRGAMPIQLGGNIARGGLFEAGFGITLGELVLDIGGGSASGRPVKAVQVGGPLGAYIAPDRFDLPFDYEAFAAADALIGHGGVVAFDDTADMARLARFAFDFCAIESCGKCTPCRIGAVRGRETVERILDGVDVAANLALIEDLCQTMKLGSLCALGGFTPYPVISAIRQWPEDFLRSALTPAPLPVGSGQTSETPLPVGRGQTSETPLPFGRGAGVRAHV